MTMLFGGSKSRTVFGPLLFIVYTADIVNQPHVFLHAFADDTHDVFALSS